MNTIQKRALIVFGVAVALLLAFALYGYLTGAWEFGPAETVPLPPPRPQ